MFLGGGRPRLFLFPVCRVCETLLYARLQGAARLGSGLEGLHSFLRWFWKRVWQKLASRSWPQHTVAVAMHHLDCDRFVCRSPFFCVPPCVKSGHLSTCLSGEARKISTRSSLLSGHEATFKVTEGML